MKSLLLALALLAAPPAVDIPAEVRPAGQYAMLSPKTDAKSITYIGLSGVEPIPSVMLKDSRMFLMDVRGMPAGRYKFVAVASLGDEHTRIDFDVVVGTSPIVINPPVTPPVVTPPGPPVNPPTPSPTAPLVGMRVLILEETSPAQAIPKPLRDALRSPQVLSYLDQKAIDPSGRRRWRHLDPSVSLANLPAEWQALRNKAASDMAARGASPDQPWVVVAGLFGVGFGVGEDVVYSGPYPATPDEAIAFFKKWGG